MVCSVKFNSAEDTVLSYDIYLIIYKGGGGGSIQQYKHSES